MDFVAGTVVVDDKTVAGAKVAQEPKAVIPEQAVKQEQKPVGNGRKEVPRREQREPMGNRVFIGKREVGDYISVILRRLFIGEHQLILTSRGWENNAKSEQIAYDVAFRKTNGKVLIGDITLGRERIEIKNEGGRSKFVFSPSKTIELLVNQQNAIKQEESEGENSG